MDRMEEYKALRDAPEELPPALEGAVARARARARRRRLWRRISAPAGSAAAGVAALVLLVNLSTPFALACGRVPVLKELAAAVAFSPSLKAAVENDYVQYIGQSATDNGITVHLEYLMADQGGLTLFLSITGPEEATSFMPRATFTTPNGERLENCSVQMDSVTPGALSNAITVAFKGEEEPQLPESLRLTCEVQAHIPDVTDAGEWTADAVVTFDFPLEQQFRGQGRTVEVNRWLELDGNNIRIVDLELYPTHARLNLEQDPDNAEELQSLDFYLEDKKGNRYEKGSASGLTAIRWRASRVLKPYLGFLATQPQPFTNTDIPFDALSDVQEGVIALKRTDPGVPQFTVLDVAPLFKDGRGLMRIELVGMDGDKEVVSASRFLLVTDLGMIVKKNADGSRDVFVCSLSEGNPISGAAVHILGTNGPWPKP